MFKVGDRIKHNYTGYEGIEAIVLEVDPEINTIKFQITKNRTMSILWNVGFIANDPFHYWDLIEPITEIKETELFCSRCTYSKVSNMGDFCNWCK